MARVSFNFFLAVFLVSLVTQTALWRVDAFTDEHIWTKRVEQLAHDLRTGELNPLNPTYSGHPGMAAMTIAAAATLAGSASSDSLDASVAILIAGAVAGNVTLCRALRPRQLWWMPAGVILLAHPLYLNASPTNAVIAPLVVLMLLLTWSMVEHPPRHAFLALALGIAGGLTLTTRIVTAALFGAPLLFMLWKSRGFKTVWFISLTGAATAFLIDPLLWHSPADHLWFIFFRSSLNVTDAVAAIPLSPSDFFLFAPFAILSVFLAITTLAPAKHLSSPIPSSLLVLLIGISMVFSIVFLQVHAQSLRHFFPLILLWEVLLPLWVLHISEKIYVPVPVPLIARQVGITALLAGSQIFLLLYALHIPTALIL